MKKSIYSIISNISISIFIHYCLIHTNAFIHTKTKLHTVKPYQQVRNIPITIQQSKIPQEYEKAIYLAESKFPAAKGRQGRITSYIIIAIAFFILGVITSLKQASVDYSDKDWVYYIRTWIGYVDISTAILFGSLIVAENNDRDEAALKIWKEVYGEPESKSLPIVPKVPAQAPVPQSQEEYWTVQESSRPNGTEPPTSMKTTKTALPKVIKPNVPKPPSTTPPNMPVQLSKNTYSKQLAQAAQEQQYKEAIESKEKRERLMAEAKRLAAKTEQLKMQVAKKNEEQRIAMEAVESEKERADIEVKKKEKDEFFAKEAERLAIEAEVSFLLRLRSFDFITYFVSIEHFCNW